MSNFVKSFIKRRVDAIISPVQQIYTNHFQNYKNNNKDSEQMRNRRVDKLKKIQKEKRYEELLKHREVCDDHEVIYFSLEECVKDLNSKTVDVQAKALLKLKININLEGSRLIDAAISAGVLSQLKQFLTNSEDEFIQCEAASIMHLIASGTKNHIHDLIDAGYEEILHSLLQSKDDDIAEEAVWTLGAMIPYFISKRKSYDVALGIARMPLLPNPSLSLLRAITWTMSLLDQPSSTLDEHEESTNFLSLIVELLSCTENDDVVKKVLRQLTLPTSKYTASNGEKFLRAEEVIKHLVNSLDADDTGIVLLSLRAMNIISGGYDYQSPGLIRGDALPALGELFNHPRAIVQRETLRCVKRISDHGRKEVTAIVENNLTPSLLALLTSESETVVKLSAFKILHKIVNYSKHDQITYLKNVGIIEAMCQMLSDPCEEYVVQSIYVLQSMLGLAKRDHQFIPTLLVVKSHGLDQIKKCQENHIFHISYIATRFVEKFFTNEPVEEENVNSDDSSDELSDDDDDPEYMYEVYPDDNYDDDSFEPDDEDDSEDLSDDEAQDNDD